MTEDQKKQNDTFNQKLADVIKENCKNLEAKQKYEKELKVALKVQIKPTRSFCL